MKKLLFSGALALCAASAMAQHPLPDVSYLEIYDLETHTHKVIKEFPYTIEAPNWSPDGKYLLINKSGKLYRVNVDGSGDLEEVNTGSITQCNNDHVITADGKWIGLSSNHPKNKFYTSYVFVVPATGGEPRQITELGPSYLHGISPDGKMAAYCAFRGPNQEQDVWVMPIKGGKEIRLTDAPGLDDGPEYSPDGKHIWFNSVRSGRMQAWRMKANGKEQTQMTFDEDMNSWFPHISPDNKKVVYIAYHDYEIDPGSHIANLNVQLRMIPAQGGEPEILDEFFGGQGSINVNSWSPDSKKFAYVSYRLKDELEAPQKDMSLQLYSLNPLLGSPEKFAKNQDYALRRLKQMGYTGVELYGYNEGKFLGMEPATIRQAVEKAGLKMTSSHCRRYLTDAEYASGNFTQALDWWKTCIQAHKAVGVNTLVYAADKKALTTQQAQVLAKYLDAVGALCKENGMRFGYHNDKSEFQAMDGATIMDYLISNTQKENVFFQLDTYWTIQAGASPVQLIKKYPGRFDMLHISDQHEIGQSGMVGFEAIFNTFEKAGIKGFIVDIDRTSTPNVLQGVRQSASFLRNAAYVK